MSVEVDMGSFGFDLLADLVGSLNGRSQASLAARPTTTTTLVDGKGKPSTWPAIRKYVLRRDDHTCRGCGARATEVDHIFPKRRGGSNFLENLQALCGTCNREKGVTADLQAATFGDLAGGVDIALERIADEFASVLLPAIHEMADRVVHEGSDPDGTLRIMETVSGEVDSLSLRVRNAIALACVEVQS